MNSLNQALSGIVTNVDMLANKVSEIKANTENTVSYVSDTAGRTKSILLNNNEMLLGSSTNTPASGGFEVEGGANNHNLIMVNKWNVVDVGTSNLPLTLNSVSGLVTIQNGNEKKLVATIDQIPNIDGIAEESAEIASGNIIDFMQVTESNGRLRFSQDKFPGMLSVSGYIPEPGDFVYVNNNKKIASDLLPDLEILLDGIFIGQDYNNLGINQTLDNIVFHASNGGIAINANNGLIYIPTADYPSPSALVQHIVSLEPSAQLAFIEQYRIITTDGKIAERAIPEIVATINDVATTLEDYQTVAAMTEYATITSVDEKIAEVNLAIEETNTAVSTTITTSKEYTDGKFNEADNSLSGLLTKVSELQSKIESI